MINFTQSLTGVCIQIIVEFDHPRNLKQTPFNISYNIYKKYIVSPGRGYIIWTLALTPYHHHSDKVVYCLVQKTIPPIKKNFKEFFKSRSQILEPSLASLSTNWNNKEKLPRNIRFYTFHMFLENCFLLFECDYCGYF